MDELAHLHLDGEGITVSGARARTETRGIEVMTDGWMTEKTRNALVSQDVDNFVHRPVQRKRTTQDGYEDGFLVIGITAITFLGPDGHSVVASHPLSFLEAYAKDMKDDAALSYTLARSRSVSAEDPLSFTFKLKSAEAVVQVLSALDRNCWFQGIPAADGSGMEKPLLMPPSLANSKGASNKLDDSVLKEAVFYDSAEIPDLPALPDGSDAPEMPALPAANSIQGYRICCTKTYISDKKLTVISSAPKERCTALFNTRGILFFSAEKGEGVMEAFTWKDVLSFGATGDDCFGFKTETNGIGGFVCCYTGQSGHLMNVLAKKYSKLSDNVETIAFPRQYRP